MKKIILLILLSFILVACGEEEVIELEAPTNIRLEENMILFDEASNAAFYEIEINNITHKTNDLFYVLEDYGTYEVRIRSGYRSNYSEYSDIQTFIYLEQSDAPYIIDGQDKTYVNGSNLTIYIYLPTGYTIRSISAPNNDINDDEYEIDNNVVVLTNSFLKRKFEEDREMLVITFVISNNKTQYIRNVFIRE